MKDKLRELAERWAERIGGEPSTTITSKEVCELLTILNAEGDGGAVAWIDGAPNKIYASEWFIAQTTNRERVVLTALPEEYTYDFKTADDTYIMRSNIKRWMQFPDSQFIPYTETHPARSGVVSDGDTMLEDLAEVVREIDADTKLVKATIAATRSVNEHHATLAQNAEDSRRLKALIAMRDRWATDEREFLNRFGQHLPTSLACLIEQFDGIMRGGE